MRIIEDFDNEIITINNKNFEGFILEEKCGECNNLLILYKDYDAYFCAYCNEWKEGTCGDSNCQFCKDRPDKPL